MPATLESFEDAAPPTQFSNFRRQLDDIKREKATLDNYVNNEGLRSDMANLQSTFSSYVQSCGVRASMAESGDTRTQTVSDKARIITSKLNEYSEKVVKPLAALRRDVLREINISTKTAEISKEFEEIGRLEKEIEEVNNDLSTAILRDNLVQTKNDAISFEQTWGYLRRPLRRNSIPILIVFALLFLIVGILGLYYIGAGSLITNIYGESTQRPILNIMLVVALIVAVILVSLKLMKQI